MEATHKASVCERIPSQEEAKVKEATLQKKGDWDVRRFGDGQKGCVMEWTSFGYGMAVGVVGTLALYSMRFVGEVVLKLWREINATR